MKEKKIYGQKPSYKFMKAQLKGKSGKDTSFYSHAQNLVYYCIKHDFNEEQVKEYLNKEVKKCIKYLSNTWASINQHIPYHIYKDIINTSKDDFILHVYKRYKYDFEKEKWTDEIEENGKYDWVNDKINFNSKENRYNTFFRQKSEHSTALANLFKIQHYANCCVFLNKKYDSLDKDNNTLYVVFSHYCMSGNQHGFVQMCTNYWHFIKLLDCVSDKDKNDINIEDLYKIKSIDQLHDYTQYKKK